MSRCRFCNHDNPRGIDRCRSCGTWLDPKADGTTPPGPRPVENPPEETHPMPGGFEGEILALVKAGQKIAAIKRYREKQGVGLREAKDAVEALAEQYGIVAKGTGCASASLLVLLIGAALLAVLR